MGALHFRQDPATQPSESLCVKRLSPEDVQRSQPFNRPQRIHVNGRQLVQYGNAIAQALLVSRQKEQIRNSVLLGVPLQVLGDLREWLYWADHDPLRRLSVGNLAVVVQKESRRSPAYRRYRHFLVLGRQSPGVGIDPGMGAALEDITLA
jgi:hypothetical protein